MSVPEAFALAAPYLEIAAALLGLVLGRMGDGPHGPGPSAAPVPA